MHLELLQLLRIVGLDQAAKIQRGAQTRVAVVFVLVRCSEALLQCNNLVEETILILSWLYCSSRYAHPELCALPKPLQQQEERIPAALSMKISLALHCSNISFHLERCALSKLPQAGLPCSQEQRLFPLPSSKQESQHPDLSQPSLTNRLK
jgi:hypothetical protein